VNTRHPLFLNQLYARADPIGVAGDWITTALHTNVHTFEVAPVLVLVEQEVLRKVASVVGGEYAEVGRTFT
jgi:glutamate/tyrosine decarboxylase-like PLP-dependent enzyme